MGVCQEESLKLFLALGSAAETADPQKSFNEFEEIRIYHV